MKNKERIRRNYKELDRSYFMDQYKEYADQDRPFPIGHGQTISQPSLVVKMTLLLDIEETSKVLEIGTGSGYQAALLAKSCKELYTVEVIEELYKKSKERLKKAGYNNISFKLGDGSQGWKDHAPYDGIMVTAAARKLPRKLVNQLALGGRMVVPVGDSLNQDLLVINKDREGNIEKEVIDQVIFVDLVGDY